MSSPVLSLKGLHRDYALGDGRKLAVLKGVDLDIMPGELVRRDLASRRCFMRRGCWSQRPMPA